MSDVVLENVRKAFGEFVAVKDLSLTIREGELLALLGPSGCGKTTTLRMIAGFMTADSGRIRFGERDITHVQPQHRNTGIVFQGYALFPHLTVAQNVAFGLEMRKVPAADIAPRVEAALAMVRMEDYAGRLPGQLSGGQQQRVALARAVVIEPDVLLLDEPLSALDAKLRQDVRKEIRALQQKLGLTTIFVTHDQDEALSLADRIVVMNQGHVEQIGTPREIYEQSRTRFVAGFIGKSNFLEGRVENGVFVTDFGPSVAFNDAHGLGAETAMLAVRPEHIVLHDGEAASSGENRISGTIESLEYLGVTIMATVRVAQNKAMTASVSGEAARAADLTIGRPVCLSWSAASTLALRES